MQMGLGGEKGKHFPQNQAILFLTELGQVIHVFLPPQLNVFLPPFLSFLANLCKNCTCEIPCSTDVAFIDSAVKLTRWKRRFQKQFWGEESTQDLFFCVSSYFFQRSKVL